MPQPPVWQLAAVVEYWAIGISAVLALTSVAYAVVCARRDGSPVPIYFLLAGATAIFFDAFGQTLGHGAFPLPHVEYFESLGRAQPLYLGLIYFFYWPPAFILIHRTLRSGISARRYVQVVVAVLVGTCAVELVPVALGWWTYYGFQPIRIAGFPLWWAFGNANGVLGTGLVLSLMLMVLPPRARFLIVPFAPSAMVAVYALGGVPVFIALNSTTDEGLIWLGTVLSIVLISVLLWLYWLIARMVGPRTREQPAEAAAAGVSG